ncbi:MAG: hypothetical protein WD059_12825 [Balneolaceae bacterium]
MFIAIEHDIHNPNKFQECADEVFPLPEGLQVHQFFPATDMSRAICLYEAPSIGQLSKYLDDKLGESSTQYYFPIDQEHSIGLPESVEKSKAV